MSQPHERLPDPSPQAANDRKNVVIVGHDGMAIEAAPRDDGEASSRRPVTELVDQPAKVMRIGSMIKQLLEEVRASSTDEPSRVRLREIHTRSIKELEDGLAPELIAELERVALPFSDDEVPSEAELRVAQAQLVGWLEGLFHGIQTALFAQQMAAQAQFEDIRRRALPQGAAAPGGAEAPGQPGDGSGRQPGAGGTGQYL